MPDAADMMEPGRDLPSRNDVLVNRLSQTIGGPVGRHALIGRARFFTPMRVMLLFAVIFLALGWFGKAACIQQDPGPSGPELDWKNHRQYTAMCYSDIVPLYGAERLDEGAFPYKKLWYDTGPGGTSQPRYMEYPVLSGLYQWGVMRLAKAWDSVRWLPGALQVAIYFDFAALGLAMAWLITLWASARLCGRRVWDGAVIACSPLVLVHAFTNFDALATALTAAGMLAFARRRPVVAGVLFGLGAATKLYPLLLLIPLAALCLRVGRFPTWWRTLAGTVAVWLAVNLPIAIAFPHGWWEFFRLNTERNMDPDSIYNVVASFTGWRGFDPTVHQGQSPATLNAVSLVAFLAICTGVCYLALAAPRRPRFAQLVFLIIAGFLLTNKVWSPQYSLWLVAPAVLAVPHRRLLLAWMGLDALTWAPRMYYYLGIANKGLPEQWFTGMVLLRDLAVVALCTVVIHQIYHPETDPVRRDGVDDPTGGILDGAMDLPWRRYRDSRQSPEPIRSQRYGANWGTASTG